MSHPTPWLAALALLIAACRPFTPADSGTTPPLPVPASTPPPARHAEPTPENRPDPAPDSVPVASPEFLRTRIQGIEIEAVRFDDRSHHLLVADQSGGPGASWPDSRAAGRALGGLAAINGGFFTPEGEPLGRVVTDGRARGGINRASSLGSGFFQERVDGTLALIRRDRFTTAHHALQSGPFLVENGRPVEGLGTDSASARSVIATDGRHGWLLARTGACSLRELGAALASETPGGLRIVRALNLDGGRSSELWVSEEIAGGPEFTRPFWNKSVRNFLVLSARRARD